MNNNKCNKKCFGDFEVCPMTNSNMCRYAAACAKKAGTIAMATVEIGDVAASENIEQDKIVPARREEIVSFGGKNIVLYVRAE